MGLRNKIILGHIRNIVWFIVGWCVFCLGFFILTIIALSLMRGDKIEEPMGPEHNWVVPKDSYMDSVKMNCGGEYHGKEGKSEYGEYEISDREYKEKFGEKEEFYY